MGKYKAALKSQNIPRLPPEMQFSEEGGASYQYKIDREKELIPEEERKASDLIARYAEIRERRDRIEDWVKFLNTQLEAAAQMLISVYEAQGIENLRIFGIGAIRTEDEPYGKVVDPVMYNEWCAQNGYIPKMGLAWQTTNKIVKERLLNFEDPPPGVEMYFRTKVVLTREK